MRYDIILSAEAEEDFRHLKANIRATVRDALERFLRHAPTKISKSRIKRLREMAHPQYRLRVGNMRVFYDVTETTVDVLAIVDKADADAWLERLGEPDETDPTLGDQE
jgi:mRNA-degrading endonuclease RelE of RelBE toxin-antitoxin system